MTPLEKTILELAKAIEAGINFHQKIKDKEMSNNLTDKAREDFLIWALENNHCNNPHVEYWINKQVHPIHLKAIIILWLNSLQYKGENLFLSIFEKSFAIRLDFMSFDDITNQTIEVCNEIYNRLHNTEKPKR